MSWTIYTFYLGLFIGISTVSEIALIPGVYVAHISGYSLFAVFLFGLVVGTINDIFWYCIGYFFPTQKLQQYRFFRREKERAQSLQWLYRRHRYRMCFLCKFLYGTQMFFQILAGGHKLSLIRYIAVSMAATVVWFLLGFAIAVTVTSSIGAVKNIIINLQMIASVTLLIGISSYTGLRWYLKRNTQNA